MTDKKEEAVLMEKDPDYGDRWTIYQDASEEWRWRRHAANGQQVGASHEGYLNRTDCVNNAIRNGLPKGEY